GRTGQARAKLHYPLKSARVPPPVVQLFQRELVDALADAVASAGEPKPEEPPPPRPAPTQQPRPTPTPAPPQETPPASAPEEAPPPTTPATPTAAAPAAPPTAPPSPPPNVRPRWARWFELAAGATLTGRRFALDPGPIKFTSAVVGGVRADFTLYPLAFTWK